MKTLTRLNTIFRINPGEGQLIGLLTLLYFVLGVAFSFTQTASFALFVATYGAQQLSYAYLVTAVGAGGIALLYLKLSERLPFATLLKINIGTLVIGSILVRLALAQSGNLSQWIIYALPMWFQIFINLGNLVVWPLANTLFDVRQGKRLFGIMGAGNWIANIIGGYMAPWLVNSLGTTNLFGLAAIGAAVSLIVLRRITRDYLSSPPPASPKSSTNRKQSATGVFKDRYLLLIFSYIFLWWLAFFFIDNIFFDRVVTQFNDADKLASFLGNFAASLSILALIITTFITGPLVNRFGLRGGLLVMPILTLIGLTGLALLGVVPDMNIVVLFWLATFVKGVNVAAGFGLDQPARGALYKPFPPAMIGRVITMAEGIVQPLAIGTAGLALLFLNTILGFRAVPLSFIFIIIAVAWIRATLVLIRAYPFALTKALAKRKWGEEARSPIDQDSIDLLQQHLRDPHPGAALYAMNTLAQIDPGSMLTTLPVLAMHPVPAVRLEAVRQMERGIMVECIQAESQRFENETDPEVKSAIIQAMAILDTPEAFARVTAVLNHPNPLVRQGAIVGLLRHGGIDGVLAVGKLFNSLLTSPLPGERVQVARILGQVGVKRYYQPLGTLLSDPDPVVRRAALQTISIVQPSQLWPEVIKACGTPETTRVACRALSAGGLSALPSIRAAFARADEQPRLAIISLARACANIQSESTTALLLEHLAHPDNEVRLHILRALSQLGYHVERSAGIYDSLREELAQAAVLTSIITILEEDPGQKLLSSALNRELDLARERVLYTLSFAYDARALLSARDAIRSGLPAQQATVIELIDSQLPPADKALVMPLFDTQNSQERLVRWQGIFPHSPGSLTELLSSLLTSEAPMPWTRACALNAIAHLDPEQCMGLAQTALDESEPILQNTAGWALEFLSNEKGLPAMFSIIERVIILKTVNIFSQVHDDVLAEVASLLEEVEVAEGETIFHKGEPGDTLYIIATGQVRVHDGNRLLNYLEERDVFGEMALLDPEPRIASVSATKDSQLLRLAQGPFYELLADWPEISTGLIRVLTRHLRDRVKDIAELNAKVRELESLK